MSKQATKQVTVRPIDTFRHQVELALPTIRHMIPAHITPDKFKAMLVTAVANNQKLLECTSASLLKAAAEAAELGLSLNPSLKEADILPVWNGRISKLEAQMRPRVKGFMKLATQSGEVTKIESHIRYAKDGFRRQYGTAPLIEHSPADGDRGEKVGVYCVWWLKGTEYQFEYMDAEDVLKIKERTSSKNKNGEIIGPWVTDEDEMWRKTVIRRASKYMPLSSETFQRAVALDDTREGGGDIIMNEEGGDIIDVTDTTENDTPAATQNESLAEKIGAKVTVPSDDATKKDWANWIEASTTALKAMDVAARREWAMKHAGELTQIEMAVPQMAKQLLAMAKAA